MGELKFSVPRDNSKTLRGATKSRILNLLAIILLISPISVIKPSVASALHIFKSDSPEAERIEKFKDNVKRDGDTLLLKSQSGTYISLKDSPKCENYETCFSYDFIDYFKDIGFYLVHSIHWEGGDVLMVSEIDGKEYYVYDLPMLSPNMRHLVTIPHDSDAGYDKNGVFIWRIDGNKLIPEFSYEPREYAQYEFVRWKDDKYIELKKWLHSSKELCPETDFMTIPISLEIEDDGWKLYKYLSSDSVECDAN